MGGEDIPGQGWRETDTLEEAVTLECFMHKIVPLISNLPFFDALT